MKNVKQVHWYNFKLIFRVAKILNECGRDMANKYNLYHWDNPMIKSLTIVVLCLLKNRVYLVVGGNDAIATFQFKEQKETLFFEKLAVLPSSAGSGCGSFCMDYIEKVARKIGKKKVRMEVYDKSQHAIDFYEHKGYVKVGNSGTINYNDLIMEKEIK